MQSKIDKSAVATAFSAAATTYDQAAIVEQEIGQRLIARLSDLALKPKYVLDLGCGTAWFTTQLQDLYPTADIIGLDLALGMLDFASKQRSGNYCCGDAELLPFANLQFDLIFSNCCMPSIPNLPKLFLELQRVLTKNGILLFTTFGPDTLQDLGLENTWQDMHIIGDILMQQNYKNPVVDMEYLTFTYNQLKTLCTDLQQCGSFSIDTSQIADLDLPCNATFEVIYGMAIKSAERIKQTKDQHGNVLIPLDQITIINNL